MLMRLSIACVPPCETGRMWWTSCTGVSRPSLRHISQRGCAAAYRSRIRLHAYPYLLFMSGERSYLSYLRRSSMRCLSQYCPSHRFGHPGWEHGRLGLCGMRLLLSTTKATAGFLPTMALYAILHDTIIPHRDRKVVHDITHLLPHRSKKRDGYPKPPRDCSRDGLYAIFHATIIPHRRRKVVHDITHLLPHRSKVGWGH